MTPNKPVSPKSPNKRQLSPSNFEVEPRAVMAATDSPTYPRLAGEGDAKKARHSQTTDDVVDQDKDDLPGSGGAEAGRSPSPEVQPDAVSSPKQDHLVSTAPLVESDSSASKPESPTYAPITATSSPQDPYLYAESDSSRFNEWAKIWDSSILHREYYMYVHEEEFDGISRAVGNLVQGYFPPPNSLWKRLDDDTRQKLNDICPQAEKLIEDGYQGCQNLFEAYIWRVLHQRLFTAQDKLATTNWALFGPVSALRDSFDKTTFFAQPYHNSMHHKARILRVREGAHVDNAWLTKILREATKVFFDIKEACIDEYYKTNKMTAPTPLHDSPVDTTGLDEVFFRLAAFAIKVDYAMISSPYRMEMQILDPVTGDSRGFPFRKADMKERRGHYYLDYENLTVDFIVEPMLRTYGPIEDHPILPNRMAQYFGSIAGGYTQCWMSREMKVVANYFGDQDPPLLPGYDSE